MNGRSSPKYIPEFDGVRAVAVLAVFVAHVAHATGVPLVSATPLRAVDAAWWVRSVALAGTFGVDLFFVLSGFLITSLLLREETASGRIHLFAFWTRRALRIWPLYFLFLAFAVAFDGMSRWTVVALSTFTANLPFWSARRTPGPVNLGALWSIHIEEQFYAAWPLLLVLTPRRCRWFLGVGMIALSVGCRLWWFSTGAGLGVWTRTPARLDALGVGTLMALLPTGAVPRVVQLVGAALPVAAVVATGLIVHHVVDTALNVRPGGLPAAVLVPLVIAMFCGATVWAARSWRWLRWSPLVYLGRISYGLYMIHPTVIGLCASLGWLLGGSVSLIVAVLLAAASYRWFEAPFLRLKRQRFTYVPSA